MVICFKSVDVPWGLFACLNPCDGNVPENGVAAKLALIMSGAGLIAII